MPLYEYQCDVCGHRFEKIQKFSDPPVDTCPKCGGKVQKQISSPAFQFKGTGWYVTDYAKKDGGSEKGRSEKAKDEKAKDSKSESKDTPAKETTSKSDSSTSSSDTSSSTPAAKPAAKD